MKYVAPAIAGAVGHLQGGLIMDAGAVRVLVVTGLIAASSAHAQVTDAELACQAATAKAMGKFTSSRSKCITKCNQGARKGTNPPSDCTPGAFAGTTAACAEAAEEKAAGTEVKSCVKDCPECYDGDGTCAPGDCGCDSVELSEEVAAAIDLYAGFVYCDDSASGDALTPIEAKCQDGTTKALAKFVGKRLRCFQQCHQKVQKGRSAGRIVRPARVRHEHRRLPGHRQRKGRACHRQAVRAARRGPAGMLRIVRRRRLDRADR